MVAAQPRPRRARRPPIAAERPRVAEHPAARALARRALARAAGGGAAVARPHVARPPGLDGGRFAVVHGLRAGYAAAEAERRSDEDLGARTAAAQAHIEKALRALDNAPAAVDDPFGYVASCLDATRAGRPPPPPPPPADGTLRGGLDGRSRAILVGALEQGLFEALSCAPTTPPPSSSPTSARARSPSPRSSATRRRRRRRRSDAACVLQPCVSSKLC